MEVIALVGQSGTGKSHRALMVANEYQADAIIDEIGQSIEARMAPPVSRATGPDINATRRFESLSPEKQKKFEDLQFGKNYDPKKW